MKPSVYMEEMDAFTYRDKLEGDSIFFIPVGALEQHGSHMAMCVDAALTKTMAGETAKALEEATNGKVHGIHDGNRADRLHGQRHGPGLLHDGHLHHCRYHPLVHRA